MIKLLEKEADEEEYFDDQWSHVVSDFSKKTSIDIYMMMIHFFSHCNYGLNLGLLEFLIE